MTERLLQFIINQKQEAYRVDRPGNLAEAFAAEGLSPIERMTRRFEIMMAEEEPVILPDEQICYLRTRKSVPPIFTDEEWETIRNAKTIHDMGYVNNITPNYEKAIRRGLLALREEADEYGQRTIDAILSLAERYRKTAESIGRDDIAEVLAQVPAHPAHTFREALQFFRILHYSLWYEGNYHVTVGRFDLYMMPYLQADLDRGALDEESALELVRDFFISFNKDSSLYYGVQKGDNGQSMMLGGIDETGRDCFNLLSSLCLKASCMNGLIDPKLNLRVSKDTPIERFVEATRLTRAGLGFPQYSNDDVVIPALIKLGYDPEDAVNYCTAACWEFIIPGVGTEVPNIGVFSYPLVIDRAMRNHLTHCDTYETFFDCVREEIRLRADELCRWYRDINFIPSPFMNVLMDCDLEKGGKYNNFGFHGAGIATAADSLAAIRKYVFDEKSVTAEELIRAVDEDFENSPALLHKLRCEAPKMGCDDDYVDLIATDLMDCLGEALRGKTNAKGGIYRAGTGTAMWYLWDAMKKAAGPDGRRRGESLGANYSVSLFTKVKGPFSVIASMTKQHFENAINGGPLTMELHQSVFQTEEDLTKVAMLVKRFVELGGHQLQINAINPDRLRDAMEHPERHRQLVVRIWGWSAYFVDLHPIYQKHVLERQVYTI